MDRAERARCRVAVNACAPGALAGEAAPGRALIHYSTDYVFDGSRPRCTSRRTPRIPCVRREQAGEKIAASGARHWIFRNCGPMRPAQELFLPRLAREANRRAWWPTSWRADPVVTLARATVEAIARARSGRPRRFASHDGRTCWHGFAAAILREFGLANPIAAISTSEYPLPAKRPANSVLDNSRLSTAFGVRLPAWEEGLREAAATLRASG